MADKSDRSDYFKERRKRIGQFNIGVPKEKLEKLENDLENKGITKTQWLNDKIDEEIRENEKE